MTTALLATPDPDPHAEQVAGLGDGRQQLGVLLAPAQEVVTGDDPLGRAGQTAVAVEAGPDEGIVRDVVAAEQRSDAVEEGALADRTGSGQQAEHGPFDTVRERRGGGGDVVRIGQPPAAGLDLGEPSLARAAELVADQAEQPVDRVSGSVPIRAGAT